MPIPKARLGETQDKYISRCMEVLISEGKDKDQAYAICKSNWDNRYESMEPIRIKIKKVE